VSEAVAPIEGKHKEGIGEFVKHTTIIVIVSVIFFAAYLFLIDHGWTYLLEGLTWLVNKIAGV
jgi:preprotein translocase SecE subunit